MPLFGPPDVDKLQAKRDIPGLIKALGYEKDPGVCSRAARALGRIGDPALEPLARALHDRKHRGRLYAAGVLGQIGGTRASESLAAALNDKDESVPVRLAAAKALVEIGDARAVEPLIGMLESGDVWLRGGAAEALGKTGDARAVEPLIAALDRDSPDAAKALGMIGDARAVDPLVRALTREDYMLDAVTRALAQIGAPAVQPLIAALGDQDGRVRYAANKALAKIDDPAATAAINHFRAIERLERAVWGRGLAERRHAAEALVDMYRTGALAPGERVLVAAQRARITMAHSDHEENGLCYKHEDNGGIGVDFPI